MNINLKGKHILLTGASRGLGKAMATELIEDGARVTIHYHKNRQQAEALQQQLGDNAVMIQADLANPEDCNRLFDEAVEKLGHIDVLVNNAGIAIKSSVEDSDEQFLADWQATLAVNSTAVALLCRKAITHFRQRSGGRIINIASRAAFRGDTADYMAYAASKGAVVPFTRSIARAFGKDNIQAFIIAPGFVRTDMAQDSIDEYGESFVMNDIALPRLTEPEDVAPLIAFLASGLADHATGTTIDVNAGSYVH